MVLQHDGKGQPGWMGRGQVQPVVNPNWFLILTISVVDPDPDPN